MIADITAQLLKNKNEIFLAAQQPRRWNAIVAEFLIVILLTLIVIRVIAIKFSPDDEK